MAESKADITHTLADALQKIENILSNDRNQEHFLSNEPFYQNGHHTEQTHGGNDKHGKMRQLAITLSSYVEETTENISIPGDTARILINWLQLTQSPTEKENLPTFDLSESEEIMNFRKKVSWLEKEKDSLLLQVSVLTDQVEVQGEKMRDVEFLRDELQIKLSDLEETVKKQNEMQAELVRKDLEIKDLRTHLETLLDEEEREKHFSLCSDSGNNLSMKAQLRENASEINHLKVKIQKLTVSLTEKENQVENLVRQLQILSTSKPSIKDPECETCSSSDMLTETEIKTENTCTYNGDHYAITTCISSPHNHPAVKSVGCVMTDKTDKTIVNGDETHRFKRESKSRLSFGKGFLKLKRTRSVSEPTLTSSNESNDVQIKNSDSSVEKTTRKKNIVGKVFGKMLRSNSHRVESGSHSINVKKFHSDAPFSSWQSDLVVSWLEDQGLGQYIEPCVSHVKTGDDLEKMTSSDLEKILGIKKVLHRKKLHLALQAVNQEQEDLMEELDNNWVLDWLDNIGLPQYKDAFRENLVDGRMLNYLTVNDAIQLKIYNSFHHHSIKRAIQCLRVHNFHPNYLKKSPIDESWQQGADVILWTNHRVTEWLRQADLSEYTTNVRGSGVHGSLMILEPRFTAESMATLLCIPSSKKLLRRHLATHFESLVGTACMKVKEEAFANGLTALIPGERHKTRRLSIGGVKKRTKSDCECEEYICPMDSEIPQSLQGLFLQKVRKSEASSLQEYERSEENQSLKPQNENELTKTLGNFSKELDSLTNLLGA